MKKHFIAALLLAVCGGVAQAQTQQELNRDGNGGMVSWFGEQTRVRQD